MLFIPSLYIAECEAMCMFKALHRDPEDTEQHRPLSREEFYRFYEVLDLTWIQVRTVASFPVPIPVCVHVHVHVYAHLPLFSLQIHRQHRRSGWSGEYSTTFRSSTCTCMYCRTTLNYLHMLNNSTANHTLGNYL